MSHTYVLQVLHDERLLARGTAWFVERALVVTAFHVVGDGSPRSWLSDELPGIAYRLAGTQDEDDVALEPVLADAQADLAFLRPVQGAFPERVLALASPAVLQPQVRWEAPSYPAFHTGLFTLTGTITAIQSGTSATALQLLVDQGAQVDWGGVSGAPLLAAGQVAGVIGRMTEATSTGWATPVQALRALLDFIPTASVVQELSEVLTSCCPTVEDLTHLVHELGWLLHAHGAPMTMAQGLAQRAWRHGPGVVDRVLQVLEVNYPAVPQIRALATKLQQHVERPLLPRTPSQTQVVDKVLQLLRRDDGPGVALLAPLGFGGRKVIDQVVTRLQTPPQRELVVRLMPRPHTTEEGRLYGALYRDLRHGLEVHLGQPLPTEWAVCFAAGETATAQGSPPLHLGEEHFDDMLYCLLTGPVKRERRVLVLVVEGLSRVVEAHLQTWAWMMHRLASAHPLKLLAWGEQELYELCTGGRHVTGVSPLHLLERCTLVPLSDQEVQHQVSSRLGAQVGGPLLYQLTHGHPALVDELLECAQVELREGNVAALQARALATAHLRRLRHEVEASPAVCETLRRLAQRDWQRRYTPEEDRLQWLGIVREDGPTAWTWVAPVFERWTLQWLG